MRTRRKKDDQPILLPHGNLWVLASGRTVGYPSRDSRRRHRRHDLRKHGQSFERFCRSQRQFVPRRLEVSHSSDCIGSSLIFLRGSRSLRSTGVFYRSLTIRRQGRLTTRSKWVRSNRKDTTRSLRSELLRRSSELKRLVLPNASGTDPVTCCLQLGQSRQGYHSRSQELDLGPEETCMIMHEARRMMISS